MISKPHNILAYQVFFSFPVHTFKVCRAVVAQVVVVGAFGAEGRFSTPPLAATWGPWASPSVINYES